MFSLLFQPWPHGFHSGGMAAEVIRTLVLSPFLVDQFDFIILQLLCQPGECLGLFVGCPNYRLVVCNDREWAAEEVRMEVVNLQVVGCVSCFMLS